MSDGTAHLRQQIHSATELQAVVRTMKAVAASSVGQYVRAGLALADYYRTVELGLHASLSQVAPCIVTPSRKSHPNTAPVGAIVFGSDQGLVGRFNDVIAGYALKRFASLGRKPQIWAVGERVHARLVDAGFPPIKVFPLPSSVKAITPLIGEILSVEIGELYLFHNRPTSGVLYKSVEQRLLPLDQVWEQNIAELPWPSQSSPEVIGSRTATLGALIREYLFVSLFRACAESLASENSTRLAAMQRAEKNIDELLETMSLAFHRLRQSSIDEELFDIVSGFEALSQGDGA